jgi:hypothetical protein
MKRFHFTVTMLLILICLALSSCNSLSTLLVTPTITPTKSLTPTATPTTISIPTITTFPVPFMAEVKILPDGKIQYSDIIGGYELVLPEGWLLYPIEPDKVFTTRLNTESGMAGLLIQIVCTNSEACYQSSLDYWNESIVSQFTSKHQLLSKNVTETTNGVPIAIVEYSSIVSNNNLSNTYYIQQVYAKTNLNLLSLQFITLYDYAENEKPIFDEIIESVKLLFE